MGTTTAPTAGSGWGSDTQQPQSQQTAGIFAPASSIGTGFSNVGGEGGSSTGYVYKPLSLFGLV